MAKRCCCDGCYNVWPASLLQKAPFVNSPTVLRLAASPEDVPDNDMVSDDCEDRLILHEAGRRNMSG